MKCITLKTTMLLDARRSTVNGEGIIMQSAAPYTTQYSAPEPRPRKLPANSCATDSDPTIHRIRQRATESRLTVLEMIYLANSGHLGSSLSCIDLVSVLKFDQMNWNAAASSSDSDVFILSKGHAVPAWYAALIVDGDLPASDVETLRQLNSRLQGHPDRRWCGLVDASTGALGQGLSMALGRAEAKRLKGQHNYVYCILGDGELQEGQVWEALMYAGSRGVSNLIAIIDHNGSQNDGRTTEILPTTDVSTRIHAFGWQVAEVDGHSPTMIRDAIVSAKQERNRPSAIIAYTQKGYLGAEQPLFNGAHGGTLDAEGYALAVSQVRAAAR